MKIRTASLVVVLSLPGLVFLGAILIKWRGFRASTMPGAFETSVARSIRDFAIPRAEHRRTNPVARDPNALAQGREAFLTRCAVCHGVNGRGATDIGANQYPRVPDLRFHSKTHPPGGGTLH